MRKSLLIVSAFLLLLGCDTDSPGAETVTGSLWYEARWIAVDKSRLYLDEPQMLPAFMAMVLVTDENGNLIGSGTVDSEGDFNIPVTQPLSGQESVNFIAAWGPSSEGNPVFAVMKPPRTGEIGTLSSKPWFWTSHVPKNGSAGKITLTEEDGSGAMFLFLFNLFAMHDLWSNMVDEDYDRLETLAILWKPGGAWSCGACFWHNGKQGVDGSSFQFDHSIFIGGETTGSSAWGWAVTLHEFGHYLLGVYSKDQSPGGAHYLGVPVAPAFAWSEGWATFFATSVMSRFANYPLPVYWDIQKGSSFWFNYAAFYADKDKEGEATLIKFPSGAGGTDQQLDENWVVGALWHIWDGADGLDEVDFFVKADGDLSAAPSSRIYGAIRSDRYLNYNRGGAGVDLVDFLDALICQKKSEANNVDATVRAMGFPYDLVNCGCNASESCIN